MKKRTIIYLLIILLIIFLAIYFFIPNTKDRVNNFVNKLGKGKEELKPPIPPGVDIKGGSEETGGGVSGSVVGGVGGGGGGGGVGGEITESSTISGGEVEETKQLPSDLETKECGYYFENYGVCIGICPEGICIEEGRSCYCKII